MDARSVVVTFEPHPVAVLAPDRAPKRIFPADEKRRALISTGVDEVVERIVAAARTGRMGDGKIFVLPAVAAGDV